MSPRNSQASNEPDEVQGNAAPEVEPKKTLFRCLRGHEMTKAVPKGTKTVKCYLCDGVDMSIVGKAAMLVLVFLPLLMTGCVSKSRMIRHGNDQYLLGRAECFAGAQKIIDEQSVKQKERVLDMTKAYAALSAERDGLARKIREYLGNQRCRCVHRGVLK